MAKKLYTAAAALMLVSLAVASAQAGGATSAASRYNGAGNWTGGAPSYQDRLAQTDSVKITEFSSSSARASAAKR